MTAMRPVIHPGGYRSNLGYLDAPKRVSSSLSLCHIWLQEERTSSRDLSRQKLLTITKMAGRAYANVFLYEAVAGWVGWFIVCIIGRSTLSFTFSLQPFLGKAASQFKPPTRKRCIWLQVKKSYLKNPIGKRTKRSKAVVPRCFLFDP